MAEPFIGEIRMFAFSLGNPGAPQGWALCNGQLLQINQNAALYSILGNRYGGDGIKTFALPDLRGKVPIQMPVPNAIGQTGGEENHVLTTSEMPAHTHAAAADVSSTQTTPTNNTWGQGYYADQTDVKMNANALSPAGGEQSHSNMQPYLSLNFCIAVVGVFPPRS